MSEPVTCIIDGGVAQVRLARPATLNALTLDTLEALVGAARELRRDRTLRGVVLGGEGESFCAGLDFATVLSEPPRVVQAFVPRPWRGTNLFQEACWAWRRLPVPVVAAVHGHCYGGGLQLALAADLRLTTVDARWSVLEARWGLIPDMSGIRSLAQVLSIDVAKRLTMTGEVIDGQRAVELGLATEVADEPFVAATRWLEQVATRSPDAVAATKALFERTWTAGPRRTFARERLAQARLLAGANSAVARTAALARREPQFGPRAR
ncbi:MAG: crotonase/enoyl-CoA hydratase family protein [Dermatophilaceae bacterium]